MNLLHDMTLSMISNNILIADIYLQMKHVGEYFHFPFMEGIQL